MRAKFRMACVLGEVIVLKLRDTIRCIVSRSERLMLRTNEKKSEKRCRVIDFEIQLESIWRTNRNVEMSIFIMSFHHASCHIPKISMDEMHARLDILILFIDKAVFVMSLLHDALNFDESRFQCCFRNLGIARTNDV